MKILFWKCTSKQIEFCYYFNWVIVWNLIDGLGIFNWCTNFVKIFEFGWVNIFFTPCSTYLNKIDINIKPLSFLNFVLPMGMALLRVSTIADIRLSLKLFTSLMESYKLANWRLCQIWHHCKWSVWLPIRNSLFFIMMMIKSNNSF